MEGAGLMKNTLIVFTADHGDFLGDHWLGEKELFYDTVQRVPFIVMDPSGEADATRGQALNHMVESVDLVPTVLRALDAPRPAHRLEGANCRTCCMACLPASPGATACIRSWTTASARPACARQDAAQCRAWSLRTDRWRYVYWLDEPEQLYDLQADPEEFQDLGTSAAHAGVRGASPPPVGMDAARPHPHHDERRGGGADQRAQARGRLFRAVAARVAAAPNRSGPASPAVTRDQAWADALALACAWASGLSSRRRILPTLVRGRSSRNST